MQHGGVLIVALLLVVSPALAQITTGTVSGSVKDEQGGVVPGATIVLISEARGTKSAPVVTNETGNYVFPNVTPDTYTADHTVDLAIARNIRLGGNRVFQVRFDIFNAFNTVVINNRERNITFRSPTDLTIVNSETLPDGSIDPARRTPRTAGFGAATGAQAMRNTQLQIRFGF